MRLRLGTLLLLVAQPLAAQRPAAEPTDAREYEVQIGGRATRFTITQ